MRMIKPKVLNKIRLLKPSFKLLGILVSTSLILAACGDEGSAPFNIPAQDVPVVPGPASPASKYLYVASGSCYAGGAALATPANMISKLDLETGALVSTVIDYNSFNPGDSPIDMVEYDADRILVLVENTAGRRIDMVNKDGSGAAIYLANATALSGVLRAMVFLSDFSLLVSKSTAIEKFNSAKARVMMGAVPFVNAPLGACAASNVLISSLSVFPNGKILYTHAGATPNNRFGLISATGYASAADCLAALTGPATTALPTASLIHSSGRTLISYGSATAASNSIQDYLVDSGANTISAASVAWSDNSIVNGPSAMTEEPESTDVFVANSASTFNTIERFSYDPAARLLTRTGNITYRSPTIYSRCVTRMKVMQ